jgi:hypothetical protein
MGASYCEMSVSRDMPVAKLKENFAYIQERDRHDNGHSYSGGFGMARGLTVLSREFPTLDAAQDWLVENAQKWGPALAVTATDTRPVLVWGRIDKPNPDHNKRLWVIGAWCSS